MAASRLSRRTMTTNRARTSFVPPHTVDEGAGKDHGATNQCAAVHSGAQLCLRMHTRPVAVRGERPQQIGTSHLSASARVT
jgi:hypothetical protein